MKAYLLKIRGGVDVDSHGKKAGKGPLIAEEISATISVTQDQYLFQPVGVGLYNVSVTGDVSKTLNAISSDADHVPCIITSQSTCYAIEGTGTRNSHHGSGYSDSGVMYTLNTVEHHAVAYSIENHPADSRVGIDDSGKVQTLTGRMGTGGGNVPMVMQATPSEQDEKPSDVVVCIQGNVIDRSDHAGANGAGWKINKCYTLNTVDRPGVAYQKVTDPLMANSHPGPYSGQDAYNDMFVIDAVAQGRNMKSEYIVRRLTPTECCRLQGFPDGWGEIDRKDDFTEEECEFWHEVRNTHAAIMGKAIKNYTKEQMLTWYNKLHTDAAEYKMWGNGISLPTAMYVLQGIAIELEKQEKENE